MIVIFCIIFLVCIVSLGVLINAQKTRKAQDKPSPMDLEYYEKSWEKFNGGKGDKCSEAGSRSYYEYPIVGMEYRRLPTYVLESFHIGYLQHDKRNKYDDMAIGVYNDDGRCVGYIPSPENMEIYDAMSKADVKKVHVLGCIEKNYSYEKVRWIGRVYIDTEDLSLPKD